MTERTTEWIRSKNGWKIAGMKVLWIVVAVCCLHVKKNIPISLLRSTFVEPVLLFQPIGGDAFRGHKSIYPKKVRRKKTNRIGLE